VRELAAALVILRLARGMKQCEVADRADTTCGMLCSYESGKQAPHARTLSRLLRALRFTYADLEKAAAFVARLKERT
jgi:transcriptional regulator with XRE-family HTH domain